MIRMFANFIAAIVSEFDRIPYSLTALASRLALANVFWQSGQAKISNWSGTLFLFEDTYKVPLLPSEVAAYMAAGMELTLPFFLIAGFATRFAALAMLGMTGVIQLFVMPDAWPVHIQWLAMMMLLVSRGAGDLSVDILLAKRFGVRQLIWR